MKGEKEMANPRVIEEYTKEYTKLEAVAKMLEALSPNNVRYEVEETYFDYGQAWLWTTIIAYSPVTTFGSYQALTPREWERIINAENEYEIAEAVSDIRNGKYFLDK